MGTVCSWSTNHIIVLCSYSCLVVEGTMVLQYRLYPSISRLAHWGLRAGDKQTLEKIKKVIFLSNLRLRPASCSCLLGSRVQTHLFLCQYFLYNLHTSSYFFGISIHSFISHILSVYYLLGTWLSVEDTIMYRASSCPPTDFTVSVGDIFSSRTSTNFIYTYIHLDKALRENRCCCEGE